MLAEDDRDALDLRLEGPETVRLLPDGEAAVDACGQARADPPVVDRRLPPGTDGVEMARRVRAVVNAHGRAPSAG